MKMKFATVSSIDQGIFQNYKFHIIPLIEKNDFKIVGKIYPEFGKLAKNFKFTGCEETPLLFTSGNFRDILVAVVGFGGTKNNDTFRKLAKKLIKLIRRERSDSALIRILSPKTLNREVFINFIDYMLLNSYDFKKYKYSKKKEGSFSVKKVGINFEGIEKYSGVIKERVKINGSVSEIRDMVNDVPGNITPDSVIKYAAKIAEKSKDIKFTVYSGKDLKKNRLNGLIAVGKCSPHEPAMIKIEYLPKNYKKRVALIGKGITFDSGGLNIKTGSHMKTMKSDMAGAGAVLGIIKTFAGLNKNIQITGYIPVAENMPGRNAYKPDDIILFRNGKSVEIVNTDAEGRLILADSLCLASEEDIDEIIEFSTLTGSIVNSLGDIYAGLMCNNKNLAKKLIRASSNTGEKICELPLAPEYKKSIESEIADLKNAGYGSASSIKAALFLCEFAGSKPFAHIDIAGTAFINKTNDYFLMKGATGYGIRLIIEYLINLTKN